MADGVWPEHDESMNVKDEFKAFVKNPVRACSVCRARNAMSYADQLDLAPATVHGHER